jgi:DNA polymerase III subunit delta
MVAVKAYQAQNFLKSPDPRLTAFLFYGSDAGLVSERSALLAATLAARDTPPGEIVRFSDEDLDQDPDRLAVDLCTIPMFGGRKIIRSETGRRINAQALKSLLDSGPMAGVLIVEAGNLKQSDALRTLFEKSDGAAAIACYGDEAQDLESVVREAFAAAKMTITPAAKTLLISRLGADRILSRGEIEKLILYARGKSEVDEDDVDAIVGDASEMAIDRIILAAASGHSDVASQELSRALDAGEDAQMIILAVQRHFHRLHRLTSGVDRGQSVDSVIGQLRPPVHFKTKNALMAQCRAWQQTALTKALEVTAAAAHSARLNSTLEDVLAERMLLTLARLARDSAQTARLR